jgi:hypothetical protein
MALACAYFGYACLPEGVRRTTYVSLSGLKKALAGLASLSGAPSGSGRPDPDLGQPVLPVPERN